MAQYIGIVTSAGQAKLAAYLAGGAQVQVTHMAVGDGNGADITPNAAMTGLVHEVHRAPITALTVHPANQNWLRAELIIPANVGGWTIREVGLIDAAGTLIAVCQFPASPKPVLADNVIGEARIRITIPVSNTNAVQLVASSAVYATTEYADGLMAGHAANADPHPQYVKRSDAEIGFIAPDATQDVSPGGVYVVDTAASVRACRLPGPAGVDRRPITIIRRGANPVDIQRAAGTDTIEGAADDLRLDKNYQAVVLAPSSATNWQILNRRK